MAGKSSKTHIRTLEIDESLLDRIVQATGVSRVVAHVLATRNLTDPEAISRFMNPNLDTDWLDPRLIPGLSGVSARVVQALKNGERIVIFGDYDLDGISAAALLVRGLRVLGGDIEVVLPSRLEDGYGLSETSIGYIEALKPQLVVTVDTGISSRDEVALLKARGIDVVITDHHEPGDLIPLDVEVANPKLNTGYGVGQCHHGCGCELAGAGVALKLLQAVCGELDKPALWKQFVDLATLGTVADVVPLLGENRALVKAGIEKCNLDPNLGIEALAMETKITRGNISAERISYSLAPRLNAAGRVATPMDALNLLLTDVWDDAQRYAEILSQRNELRRKTELDMSQDVLARIEATYKGERAIVLKGENWHDGVKGIVASRVAETYGVPTLLCSVDGDHVAVGSGRSVGSVDLFAALEATSAHLVRWGGHAAAAGLAVEVDKFEAFKADFIAYMNRLPEEQFHVTKTADALVHLDEISLALAEDLQALEPYGSANPRPLLLSQGIAIKNQNCVGRDGQHLKFQAVEHGTVVPAIYFRCPDIELRLNTHDSADMAFHVEIDEFQNRRRVNVLVQELRILEIPDSVTEGRSEFIAELFERADETIQRREYDGILDAPSFYTKLVGVTFEGRQEAIAQLKPDEQLELRRDCTNAYDTCACGVWATRLGVQIGFLNRNLAAVIGPAIDEGVRYSIELASLTGGQDGHSYGVNVVLYRTDVLLTAEGHATYRMHKRKELEGKQPHELEELLVSHFIGDNQLHSAQEESLRALSRGENTLTVMATGRGKSLIFHMHAARMALLNQQASIFVYPLRALVTDQAYHLEQTFAEIGLSVAVVTGESSETARAESFESLREGRLDVVLTTPEFLHFHAEKFAAAKRVGFVVVDEAHHIGQARAGNRPAYAQLRRALELLDYPVTLAVTATANDEVADRICDSLLISNRILDPSERHNLVIKDERNCQRKEPYVFDIARSGDKMVVYVNSRKESVNLARNLRRAIPELAWKIAFYNGGLAQSSRQEIERRFRTGDIRVVVATSAFGEGVNIPDVRHVVLYHLPFSDVEFNQMAGRGGRDGAPANVHLLFGEKDAKINETILQTLAPHREAMVAIYSVLRNIAADEGERFSITNEVLAERANDFARRNNSAGMRLNDRAVSVALSVFRELGFITTEGLTSSRKISLVDNPGKVELHNSVRYAEGLEEIEDFSNFKLWVLDSNPQELLERFNKPILPNKKA